MYNFFKKIFKTNKKITPKDSSFKKIYKSTEISKLFDSISNFNDTSEIRYVGGCVRKILNQEDVDDIDLAVNLNPNQVKECLQSHNIKFFETCIKHGTITANIGQKNFEITSLREDVDTDGRHANVRYTTDWLKDSSRRDFTINSIYADKDGNLFDPNGGAKDIEEGKVIFIGNADNRIQEDPVRMIRALRFSAKLNFSIDENLKKSIKKNSDLLCNIPSARIFEEFKKLFLYGNAEKVFLMMQEYNIFNKIFFDTYEEIKQDKLFNNFIIYALQDSDRRVLIGQPVSPMFLLGIFFWASIKKESLRIKKRNLLTIGKNEEVSKHIFMA